MSQLALAHLFTASAD